MESVQTVSVSDVLINFIKENFITGRGKENIDLEQSLIDSGIIDSTGILELVMFLE